MLTSPQKVKYQFDRHLFIRIIVFIICVLFIGHCLSVYLLIEYPNSKENGSFLGKLIKLFNFDIEANLPTYFSSLLLLLNAVLLAFIAYVHKQAFSKYLPWAGLAIIFLFLSLDEMIGFHEHLIQPTRNLFNTSGYLYYAWVIPYLVIMFMLGFIYAGFFMRLPRKILFMFVLSAIVFVSGAVGMELLGSMQDDLNGRGNLVYHLMYTVEETLEMSGSAIFCFALLTYSSLKFKSVSFKFQTK